MSLGTKEQPIAPETKGDDPELVSPSDKADYIDLGHYIKRHLVAGERIEEEVKGLGRKATIHRFYAGEALKRVWTQESKARKWVVWCENHSLNVGTCYEAMRLFERAVSVDNVKNLTVTEARKKYQTEKRSFVPEGAKVQPKKAAPKLAPKIKYNETETLKALRSGIESVVEAVTEVDAEDWKNADPETYVSQIDGLVEKLKQAKQAILGARRITLAELKATSKVEAKAAVVKGSSKEARPAKVRA